MGCDIHTIAEIQSTYDDSWRAITDPVFPYEYFREDSPIRGYNHPYSSTPSNARNYVLFSVLANVRNGSAWTLGHTPLDYLAEPRGVPEDASKKWKKYVNKWGPDLHSVTYFTATELRAAVDTHFNQSITERGYLYMDDYLALRDRGVTPSTWCGGVGGGGVVTFTAPEFDQLERSGSLDTLLKSHRRGAIYVAASWEDNVASYVEFFVNKTLPALELQSDNPDRVRLMIGFDN